MSASNTIPRNAVRGFTPYHFLYIYVLKSTVLELKKRTGLVVTRKSGKGFIALLSVIILGFVFLAAAVSLSHFGLAGRLLLLDLEEKARSEGYAAACVEAARILVANDAEAQRSSLSITYGALSCTIVTLEADEPSVGESTIKSRGVSGDAVTNLVVILDAATADVTSWQEYAVMP
ncbi:MAG: hypothetical protein WBK28_03625 [Minisyncoccia bacterium]